MEPEETMVENDNVEADDALPEDVVEEEGEPEESLDSAIEDEAKPETQQPQTQGTSEPGWIKKRVSEAVEKAVARTRAEMQAAFEQQMAPIREKMLNDEARELVRTGEFKSLDRAVEYLRLKGGMPTGNSTEQPKAQQPRNERGQFTSQEDVGTSRHISMLRNQAEKIQKNGGPNVIDEFTNNPEIKQKVIAGEMDFYDVAEYMKQNRRRPPSPMRSPNGASGNNPNAIESMSDEQFRRLEKRISEGARIRLS